MFWPVGHDHFTDAFALRMPLRNGIVLFLLVIFWWQVLLRGSKNAREAVRHFGRAPGVPHSSTKYGPFPLPPLSLLFLHMAEAVSVDHGPTLAILDHPFLVCFSVSPYQQPSLAMLAGSSLLDITQQRWKSGMASAAQSSCRARRQQVSQRLLVLVLLVPLCRPYVRSKGRKFEKARGRRKSRGYKV